MSRIVANRTSEDVKTVRFSGGMSRASSGERQSQDKGKGVALQAARKNSIQQQVGLSRKHSGPLVALNGTAGKIDSGASSSAPAFFTRRPSGFSSSNGVVPRPVHPNEPFAVGKQRRASELWWR